MGDESSVRVALRVRPQIPREIIDMCRVCTTVAAGEPQLWLGKDKAFTFDFVFDMDSDQASIYDSCIAELIDGCFDGFNATVLAYGQTGSGKTYTMGTGFDMNVSDDEYGIIPRAVDHLFQGIDDRNKLAVDQSLPSPEFKVICQFMELYNEEVIDLFDTARDGYTRGRKSNIKIQEDPLGGICVAGLTNKIVTTKHETMQCLKSGALSRTTASTQMNVQSSRSHAVFTLHIKQQRLVTCEDPVSDMNEMSEFETLTAKFHFVDLAGSERLKRTGATGERQKEGISINCGLLALGNVISALGDKTKRGSHVPYRDSKLTRLLQDSLGGNSRTIMIACISPSDRDFMETLNTLKYANRARNIKNKITVNQDKTSQTVSALRVEIQRLQLELLEYKQGKRLVVDGVESVNDMYHENTMLQTENNHLRTRIKAMQETIEQLKANNVQLATEKALGNWITPDNANSDMTQLVQGYLKEIEDLRVKQLEAENTCQILRRTASRVQSSMLSPRPSSTNNFETVVDADETTSVDELIETAKLNIVRLKRREKRLKSKPIESESELPGEEQEKDDAKSDDEGTEDGDDLSDLSSESDSEEKENIKLEADLAELTCEISIKQKLIEELERSQRRLYTLRQQYEEKLMQLQNKMKATQEERDKVISNFGSMGNHNEEKVKKVKDEYERKLQNLQNEMKKLQEAKKRHAQLLKNQSQYEQQVKTMRSDLADMKKAKVRLLNKMKEESVKHKESEARRNREIAQLKKESRQHEIQIRTLTAEKRTKEGILRRKQEEVSALRKLVKPMSDKVAGRTARPRSKLSAYETKKTFSPKLAKVKWQTLENGINKISLHRQSVTNLEKNMERYLEERNKLRRYIERLVKKRDKAILQGKDEMIKYFEDQVESAKVNIDYVQENITECQTNIMQMEEPKEGADINDASQLMSGMGSEDVKYILEKLVLFSLNQSTSALQKDTNLKEVEASMQQIVKNSTLQEQLLEHIIASKELDDDFNLYSLHDEPEPAVLSSGSSRSVSPAESTFSPSEAPLVHSILNADEAVRRSMRDKVRRRTATPEELLGHGAVPNEAFAPMAPIVDAGDDNDDENENTKASHEERRREVGAELSNGFPKVASAPGSLKGVIMPYTGRLRTAPLVCTHVAEGHSKAVLSVDATDDLLFSASKDRTAKVWDLNTCKELETLEGHPSNVTAVKYSPKMNLVFSVSSSLVKVWDIRESPGKCVKTLSSLGLIVHTTTAGGTSRTHANANGKELQINDIALNDNGTTFFSASGNIVRVWDLRKFLCTGKLSGGHQAAVMCLAVSDEFKRNSLVVTGSKDHYIKVFEVADGMSGMHTPRLNLEPPHYDGIESLTVTGRYLFSGSRDTCIKKWDLSGKELLKQSLTQAHKDWVCGLKVLPGGQVLISGCRGGYLKLWNVDTCAQLGEIKAHASPINAIATNASSLFSASSDGTVGVWRMKSMTDSLESSEIGGDLES